MVEIETSKGSRRSKVVEIEEMGFVGGGIELGKRALEDFNGGI